MKSNYDGSSKQQLPHMRRGMCVCRRAIATFSKLITKMRVDRESDSERRAKKCPLFWNSQLQQRLKSNDMNA